MQQDDQLKKEHLHGEIEVSRRFIAELLAQLQLMHSLLPQNVDSSSTKTLGRIAQNGIYVPVSIHSQLFVVTIKNSRCDKIDLDDILRGFSPKRLWPFPRPPTLLLVSRDSTNVRKKPIKQLAAS